MPKVMPWLLMLAIFTAAPGSGAGLSAEQEAVDLVLSSFHAAAAVADGGLYFSLLADDAIYIGTDASERWTADEFKAFAEPYFSDGRGWTYTATERHIAVAPDGSVAWFDEMLVNDTYGVCRGTGVLVLEDGVWRIAQYHLTFPIPNDLALELTARIKEQGGQKKSSN
jgi:hypothetical protein